MKKIKLFILFICLCSFKVGFATNIENTDYVQILIYCQSLGMGWEAPRAITTNAIEGNYMLSNSPLMRSNLPTPSTLSPLVATIWGSGGEQPIVSCVNAFSDMYRQNINPNQKFIGMTAGEGGRTIERLSKECTNNGYYETSFLKTLNGTLNAMKTGETVSCPAIVYMQGEYNCNELSWYLNQGLTPGTNGTTDKDEYKRLLLVLKNNMQNDIMQKYGQSKKPLFFIYQVSGAFIRDRDMPIAMAQYEFALENDDVIMLNPHYGLPDYGGGHLSTNGYRWYGEIIGNILYDVLAENKTYTTVHPTNFTINGNKLIIDYYVPEPPLVLNTWTNNKATDFGFSVYNNNSTTIIQGVEIVDGNKVVITTDKDLTGKEIEVVYAGNKTTGTGNVCDSYSHISKYTFFDDSADTKKESYTPKDKVGNNIYGKNYPMQNWSVGFYYKFPTKTGLSDNHIGKRINVWPNPTTGIVNIENMSYDQSVSVFDYIGELLMQSKSSQLDLSSFTNGVYFVKTSNVVYKIIKY